MTTAPLSLKIFPQDENIKFVGWQTKFKNLIEKVFLSEDLPGVLPDFKGFTKAYNRSNWFQPLYEGALARKPLVVRIDEDDVWALKDTGWQHKVRLAWHSICKAQTSTVFETKLEAPVTVAISTNALPLIVKDTEAYKAIIQSDGFDIEVLEAPYSNLSQAQSKAAKEESFDTLQYMLSKEPNFLADSQKVETLFTGWLGKLPFVTTVYNDKDDMKDQEKLRNYSSEVFIQGALLVRFFWSVLREMGVDVQAIYESDKKINTGAIKQDTLESALNYFSQPF